MSFADVWEGDSWGRVMILRVARFMVVLAII